MSLEGKKVAIVTGGNKGIGFAIVKALCSQFQGDVFLTARDEERGKAAVEELKKLGLNPKFYQLDISEFKSILKFRDFLRDTYGGVDVLINNAATAYKKDATEPFGEQAEVTVRVNFTNTLELCQELFPLLRRHARVVNISSSEGHLTKIPSKELRDKFSKSNLQEYELVDLMKEFVQAAKAGTHVAAGWPNSAYQVSKVGVSALTRVQQWIMETTRSEDKVLVNCVHPGYVDTDMTSHKGQLKPDEGAIAATLAALIPSDCESPRGAYIWYDTQVVDWVNGPTPTSY